MPTTILLSLSPEMVIYKSDAMNIKDFDFDQYSEESVEGLQLLLNKLVSRQYDEHFPPDTRDDYDHSELDDQLGLMLSESTSGTVTLSSEKFAQEFINFVNSLAGCTASVVA